MLHPRARSRRLLAGALTAWAAVALVLAAGCARQGFPPGGPRDIVPPHVLATEPDSGATRVAPDADVAITFSEPMNRGAVLDWVLLSPPRDFGERRWDGTTLRLSGGEDFLPDLTTTVIVGTGAKDEREGNAMLAPYVFIFSTGDSVDQGRIEGRLGGKGQRPYGTMVWALDVERAAARPDTMLPDYVTQAAQDSTFTLIGLKAGRRYLVMAHFDANRDREFDRETEFLSIYGDTLWLDPARPVATGVVIDFRDPRAPGTIAGAVVDSTGERTALSLPPAAGALAAGADTTLAAGADTTLAAADSRLAAPADSLRAAAPDTARAPSFVAEAWLRGLALPPLDPRNAPADTAALATAVADSLGRYALKNLPPGWYRVTAYLDRDGNRRYDPTEPAASPVDSVRVDPLEETAGIDLIVRPRPR
jgi:uncharacterized protein (DUF2141 family)